MEGRITTLRAGPDDHGQRHRAHRVDDRQRPGDRQGLLPADANLDTAIAQVTAIAQTVLRQLPPGTKPPLIINYNASSVPILQLGAVRAGLSEQQLFDLGVNFLRTQLVTVQGASIPYPYGGKQRQIMVDLDPRALQAKGLSPADVVNAISLQNLILPVRHGEDRRQSNTTST